jgi:hypothetical protein
VKEVRLKNSSQQYLKLISSDLKRVMNLKEVYKLKKQQNSTYLHHALLHKE